MIHEFVKTESPLVRIEAILGREIYEHLRPFEFEDRGIKISGFGSLPSFSKGNGDGIFIYVNRRYVKDRMIYRAIVEAYRHVIPAGKFPVVVLFIDLSPSAVDVNVHPTKAEVKFKEQERIFQAVIGSLRSVHDQGSTATPPAHGGVGAIHELPLQKWGGKEKGLEFSGMSLVSLPFKEPYPRSEAEDTPAVKESSGSEWKTEGVLPMRLLGQVLGTYILFEGEEGIVFIDQHAAHERLLFEKYKKDYETGSIVSERLLIPIAMELSAEESFIMSSHLREFESMGFEIDPLGEKAYALRSIPSLIGQKNPKEVVRKIMEELSSMRKEGKGTEVIRAILVTLACHSAIRANFMLRREEMEGLVQDLHPLHLSTTCPHGRPVFFVLPHNELSKQFKRKPS
jgi:DNA mismatch repair protein MutL